MSLYDNHTAKQPTSSCLVGNNKRAGAKKIIEEVKKVQPVRVVVNEQVGRSKAGSPFSRFPNLTVSPTAIPCNLSTSDFPVLGTTVSRTEEKKAEGGKGPVFNESYYSQVREVHGANMRAAEALLEDEDNFGRRRKTMSSKDVNCLVEDVMRALAGEGEHVTLDRVISRVCSLLQVSSLKDMNIDTRRHLPAVQELQRTIKEINMYIESVEVVSSICTLYELGQALANLKNKKRFEELHLGPLCKILLFTECSK
ncbi:uncharacterized protein LOC122332684 [Puntigrus tetrazona]|uniref:uncharacterized protein LOC122332684 n=1 Tax=Puntigrus tetrazona TaxID=1606681 RepID=UPI001C8B0425|nr:uncharacterized protein LOC122332684 [Puntigrus tetrazona]